MQQLTSYEQVVRTPNHDNFGLAVTIFRLLFAGRHPFSGRYQGQGDAPSIEDAIKASLYAYSERRQTGLQPPANALPIDALPTDLRDMFELAFDPGTTNGGRPIAGAWMTALQTLGRNVRQCDAIRSHWFYSKAPNCPWCDIEQSGAAMFGGATQRQRPHPGPGRTPQAVPASQAIAPLRRVGFAIVGVLVLIGVVVNLASSNKATSIALSRPCRGQNRQRNQLPSPTVNTIGKPGRPGSPRQQVTIAKAQAGGHDSVAYHVLDRAWRLAAMREMGAWPRRTSWRHPTCDVTRTLTTGAAGTAIS